MSLLLQTIRDLINEEKLEIFACELIDRILDKLDFDSKWIDITQSDALTEVFDDIYFAKILERVIKEKNKHKQELLKN